MVLHRLKVQGAPVKPQAFQHIPDATGVAPVTAIAIKNRIQCAIGGIPIACGIVPARWRSQADRGKWHGNHIHVSGTDTGPGQAKPGGLDGHGVLSVFVTAEALFLDGSHEGAVYIERC